MPEISAGILKIFKDSPFWFSSGLLTVKYYIKLKSFCNLVLGELH